MKKNAVIVNCFGWYERRMKPIREILIAKGYDVYIFNSDYSHLFKADQIRFPEVEYIHVMPYKKNISIKRILSHIDFALKINKKLSEIQPELIYAMIPPNTTGWVCSRFKRNNQGVKLIVDIIDLWPESMPIGKYSNAFLVKLWRKIRKDAIHYGDYVVTECNYYRELIKDELKNKRATSIPLFKIGSRRDDEKKPHYKKLIANKLTLAYIGTINSIIDIDSIISISEAFISFGVMLHIKIIGDGENKKILIDALSKCGVEIFDYGIVFDEEMKREILGECDLALNLMKDSVKVGLTTKSVDYLSYGLPMINNLKGDNKSMVMRGAGFQFDGNVDEIVKKILDADLEQMHENAFDIYLEDFTEDSFKENIQSMLDEVL